MAYNSRTICGLDDIKESMNRTVTGNSNFVDISTFVVAKIKNDV